MDGSPETVTRAYLDSVRATDEADHIARFRSLVGIQSLMRGYYLEELKLSSNQQQIRRLTSGAPLQVSCELQQPEFEAEGLFCLRCIRLDGALICEHDLVISGVPTHRALHLTYPCFNLAPGLYRLQLEWKDAYGMRRAESATLVEIVADDTSTGGRPVLHGIGHIESVSVKEEI
jgi:hypothetical protein